jgi:hypothetical protein
MVMAVEPASRLEGEERSVAEVSDEDEKRVREREREGGSKPVFQHLFDHARRPLDHLSCCDLVDQTYRQLSYDWHPSSIGSLK